MIAQMGEATMLVQDKNDLEKARNRAERAGARSAAPSAMFEKVLRAFEIGDLSFSDLESSLTRLLKDGAPAEELLRVLRRRESIEPLPEEARDRIVAALHEAMPPGALESGGRADPAPPAAVDLHDTMELSAADDEPDTSAMSRLIQEFAAAWDTEPKERPAPAAAAAPESTGQNVDYKAMRLALGQREDDLAALQAEHSRVLVLLEARARSAAQLQEELRELSDQLEASRGALQLQQKKTREIEEVLAERVGAEESARLRREQTRAEEEARQQDIHQRELSALREALAARDAGMEQSRHALAERDAAIESLQRSLAEREAAVAEREAAVEHAKRALTGRDGVIEQARALLAERDAQIAALQSENTRLTSAVQAGESVDSAAASKQAELERQAAAERLAAAERQSAADRDAVAARDAWADKVLSLQRSLDERDAAIEAQKQQHSKVVSAFMARAKATESELKTARDRIEALAAELQSKATELQSRERDVAAVREQNAAREQQAMREQQGAREQQVMREHQGAREQQVMREQQAAREELETVAFESEPDLEQTLPLQPLFQASPPRLDLRRDLDIGEFSPPPPRTRAPARKAGTIARTAGICAVLVVLAVVAWVAAHHAPAAATQSVAAAAPVPAPGTVIRDCPTCPSFTVLPVGRFKQGSADANASATVKPLHWVAIKYPIAMSTSAVTVDEFRAFATATGRDMQGCDVYDGHWKNQPKSSWQNPGFEQSGTHPVTCTSWSDATAYAQWLSQQTGHHYRLPSASEWEYAARGGSEAAQPWSANGSDACANANVADLSAARRFPGWVAFACNDGYVFTAPVGSFKANAFGLSDMLGNVFQWTDDCWTANYKGAPIDGSARADGNCSERELRGGSWFSSPGYVRADYRNHFAANYRASSTGIRLVRDIAP